MKTVRLTRQSAKKEQRNRQYVSLRQLMVYQHSSPNDCQVPEHGHGLSVQVPEDDVIEIALVVLGEYRSRSFVAGFIDACVLCGDKSSYRGPNFHRFKEQMHRDTTVSYATSTMDAMIHTMTIGSWKKAERFLIRDRWFRSSSWCS
ncbi:hypothetical protein PsorP6_011502 [Peronosclerospora sorghi]|uniref:Uncharacterized protein n=1 Tax=Peronosclerospora sorghi TaxID=230839 RepID=A0ACC0WIA5_9STRA|nr:hypothetical protein PsorP6_011502 [Peronosclerospora sorghi]